jgi:hypothetical protein
LEKSRTGEEYRVLPDTPLGELLVLVKPGLSQNWHPHLATAAGRPRCGALLNLREWQLQRVAAPPRSLCARCARLLNPRTSAARVPVCRVTPAPDATQLGLPLDDAEMAEQEMSDQ